MEKKSGLNTFDIIYFINLRHRKDRLDNILVELSKTNIETKKISRIDACYLPNNGALGCSVSHFTAIKHFINTPDNIKNCIILEDDFQFTESQIQINQMIDDFFFNNIEYDVLLLSSNTIKEKPTEYDFITKIYDAQTTSGYCLNKKFAPKLLENFKESIINLQNRKKKKSENCCDINWKKLQPSNNWYCLKPKVGKQIMSYSDIEKKYINSDC